MRIKTNIDITLGFVKSALGHKAYSSDFNERINAISTDTRELKRNDLFIAIPGESFNGEDFIEEAKLIGAYILSAKDSSADVYVKNTLTALMDIASAYKQLLELKHTVAITGSVGKTTTKNLLSELLSVKYNVHATYKNFNNEIGVPFTVLGAPANTDILVIEAGMNHAGELSSISKCIEPDISVITKIGSAHIGNLGSREKIADAKCEILSGMKTPFTIIPSDEPLLSAIPSRKTVSLSDADADSFLFLHSLTESEMRFSYRSKAVVLENITVKLSGAHTAECLAFAISVCEQLSMTKEEISEALSLLDTASYEKTLKIAGLTVIDDSYNSSPEAVISALNTLRCYPGKHSALIGDMLELGDKSEELHYEIGKAAATSGISTLYLIGKYAKFIKNGALQYGFDEKAIFLNDDCEDCKTTATQIKEHSEQNEVILFKASRKLKLERIIELLKHT